MADSTSVPSSNGTSQATHGEVDVSPPTSAEGPSSQEQESNQLQIAQAIRTPETRVDSGIWSGNPQMTLDEVKEIGRMDSRAPYSTPGGETRPGSTQGKETSRPSSSVNAGSKRTASGAAVRSAHSRPSPSKRSKQTDVDTQRLSAEKISELSAQLSTRLSYAYVKLKHGWGSRTLDEVEILAAQENARAAVARAEERSSLARSSLGEPGLSRDGSSLSDDHTLRSSFTSDHEPQHPSPQRNGPATPWPSFGGLRTDPGPDAARSVTGARSGTTRTYEAFWRDHATSPTTVSQILGASSRTTAAPAAPVPPPPPPPAPTLGPPVNLFSDTSPSRFQPERVPYRSRPPPRLPSISTAPRGVSELTNISLPTSASLALPTTPSPPQATRSAPSSARLTKPNTQTPSLLRTPSDKTAMEQDAVETLLYMSSPRGVHSRHSTRQGQASMRSPGLTLSPTGRHQTTSSTSRVTTTTDNTTDGRPSSTRDSPVTPGHDRNLSLPTKIRSGRPMVGENSAARQSHRRGHSRLVSTWSTVTPTTTTTVATTTRIARNMRTTLPTTPPPRRVIRREGAGADSCTITSPNMAASTTEAKRSRNIISGRRRRRQQQQQQQQQYARQLKRDSGRDDDDDDDDGHGLLDDQVHDLDHHHSSEGDESVDNDDDDDDDDDELDLILDGISSSSSSSSSFSSSSSRRRRRHLPSLSGFGNHGGKNVGVHNDDDDDDDDGGG